MKQPRSHATLYNVVIVFCILVLLPLTGFLSASSGSRAEAASAPAQCNRYVIPVHESALDLVTHHIVAHLCYPQNPGSVVQVLVHGGTYGHIYWDFSCLACQTNNYSYVQYMAQAGYTTFNYDRLGYGESDHPLPELVTVQMAAYVLSQLITDLRTGAYGGPAFQKVILVGHSIGSAIVVEEASDSTLAHPDGVILSGFLHFLDTAKLSLFLTDLHPADVDPNPRFSGLLPGYITTIPGSRGQIFYDLANTDPQVIAQDEATKETVTDSEVLTTFTTIATSTISQKINVPVLEAVGQFDNLFCLGTFSCTNNSSVIQNEAPFYSSAAQLDVIVIPQAGHDLNLQLNAVSTWYPQVAQWLQKHF